MQYHYRKEKHFSKIIYTIKYQYYSLKLQKIKYQYYSLKLQKIKYRYQYYSLKLQNSAQGRDKIKSINYVLCSLHTVPVRGVDTQLFIYILSWIGEELEVVVK